MNDLKSGVLIKFRYDTIGYLDEKCNNYEIFNRGEKAVYICDGPFLGRRTGLVLSNAGHLCYVTCSNLEKIQ